MPWVVARLLSEVEMLMMDISHYKSLRAAISNELQVIDPDLWDQLFMESEAMETNVLGCLSYSWEGVIVFMSLQTMMLANTAGIAIAGAILPHGDFAMIFVIPTNITRGTRQSLDDICALYEPKVSKSGLEGILPFRVHTSCWTLRVS